jgi:cytidyltransferase-like protein
MTRVLVFGTFDHLHPGHRALFAQAKAQGDHLVVVVARDATVHDVKGRLPDHAEEARLAAVRAAPEVDEAVLGNTDDKWRVIHERHPDIILLGYDQTHFLEGLDSFCRAHHIRLLRAAPFAPDIHKSSKIRERLTHP